MTFILHSDLVRDGILIGEFKLCRLLMINDAAYPWFILVPQVPGIKDAYELTEDQHQQVTRESRILSEVLMVAFDGDKMNVAALGNMTPQLHIHHIVRYARDPAWPGPIWGVQPMQAMTEVEIENRREKLRGTFENGMQDFTFA